MAQQTAVEWLFETMTKTPMTNWYEVRKQAKQMEKEQIINAHYQGYRNFIDTTEISEQYYNETYGQ